MQPSAEASGIGRFGGMTGPILGGFLLTMTLPNFMNFAVFSVVGIVAAIGLSLIADKYSATNILVQQEKEADSAKTSEVAASLE